MSKFRNPKYKNVWQFDDGLYICQIGYWEIVQYYLIIRENSKRWTFNNITEADYLEITNLTYRADGKDSPKGWKSKYFIDNEKGTFYDGVCGSLRDCIAEVLNEISLYFDGIEEDLNRAKYDLYECQDHFDRTN